MNQWNINPQTDVTKPISTDKQLKMPEVRSLTSSTKNMALHPEMFFISSSS